MDKIRGRDAAINVVRILERAMELPDGDELPGELQEAARLALFETVHAITPELIDLVGQRRVEAGRIFPVIVHDEQCTSFHEAALCIALRLTGVWMAYRRMNYNGLCEI